MPSLHATFIVADLLLTTLAAGSPSARENIKSTEHQNLTFGGYVER